MQRFQNLIQLLRWQRKFGEVPWGQEVFSVLIRIGFKPSSLLLPQEIPFSTSLFPPQSPQLRLGLLQKCSKPYLLLRVTTQTNLDGEFIVCLDEFYNFTFVIHKMQNGLFIPW